METWRGSSVVIIENEKLLIVKSKSEQKWSIPTGGIETGETPIITAVREVFEETGYNISIIKHIDTIKKQVKNYNVEVYYFLGHVESGVATLNDPDKEIEDICWIAIDEYEKYEWLYPEDATFIRKLLSGGLYE